MNFFLVIGLSLFLVGCSTTVTQLDNNVYMAHSSGSGFNPSTEVAEVREAAEKLAREKNKVVVPIDLKTQAGVYGRSPPAATFQFKLVDKGSKEINRTSSEQMGLEKLSITSPDINKNSIAEKLEDAKELYDKKLITEAEYQTMRKIIIQSP